MDSAADRLRRRGLDIQIFAGESLAEAMPHLDNNPGSVGFLSVLPDAEGALIVNALVRPGLSSVEREQFAAAVEERIDRIIEHGPDPDGWQR